MQAAKLLTSEGALVDYGSLATDTSGPFPNFDVITALPLHLLEEDQITLTMEKMACLLGSDHTVFFRRDVNNEFTGDTVIKVTNLSQDGARRLSRGYWTPYGETLGPTVFAVDKRLVLGTTAKPIVKINHLNALEVRFKNPKDRNTAFKVMEAAIQDACENIPDTVWLNSEGRRVTEDEPGARPGAEVATSWLRGSQTSGIHRLCTPAGFLDPATQQLHLTHETERRKETKCCAAEPAGWKVECPYGITQVIKGALAATQSAIGHLAISEHTFEKKACKDLLDSWNAKQPMKDGMQCSTRALIRIVSIPCKEEEGITHPVAIPGFLKFGFHTDHIGSVMLAQTVKKDSSVAVPAYIYLTLIEKPTTDRMSVLTTHSSAATKIAPWDFTSTMQIDPVELHLNDQGRPSVIEPGAVGAQAKVTTDSILSSRLLLLRTQAVEDSTKDAGYERGVREKTKLIVDMEKKIECHNLDIKLMALQKQTEEIDRAAEAKAQADEEAQRMQAEYEVDTPMTPEAHLADPLLSTQTLGNTSPNFIETLLLMHDGTRIYNNVDVLDIPGIDNAQPSLIDLVYYLVTYSFLPSTLGLAPSEVQEPIRVYLEAAQVEPVTNEWGNKLNVEESDPYQVCDSNLNQTQLLPTVGKSPQAGLYKLGLGNAQTKLGNSIIIFSARIPGENSKPELEWLTAKPEAAPSPEVQESARPPTECVRTGCLQTPVYDQTSKSSNQKPILRTCSRRRRRRRPTSRRTPAQIPQETRIWNPWRRNHKGRLNTTEIPMAGTYQQNNTKALMAGTYQQNKNKILMAGTYQQNNNKIPMAGTYQQINNKMLMAGTYQQNTNKPRTTNSHTSIGKYNTQTHAHTTQPTQKIERLLTERTTHTTPLEMSATNCPTRTPTTLTNNPPNTLTHNTAPNTNNINYIKTLESGLNNIRNTNRNYPKATANGQVRTTKTHKPT